MVHLVRIAPCLVPNVDVFVRFAVWICFCLALMCPLELTGVTLKWGANTEPDLAGYKLHWGPVSGTPSQHRTLSTLTTTTVDDAELPIGVPIYFTVTAFNLAALESLPSNEIMWIRQISAPAPTPTPTPTPLPTPSPTPTPPSQNLRVKLTITYTREFEYGTTVSVTAPNEKFLRWSGDVEILDNCLESNTSATIPSMDVRIEAIYNVPP